MREHLAERLALVRGELDTLARESGRELARQLELRVRPHLDRATALLERDSHAAFAELDAARLAQTLLLADRLAASLEAPGPSFLGMTPGWPCARSCGSPWRPCARPRRLRWTRRWPPTRAACRAT
jgi:hypothetical protein